MGMTPPCWSTDLMMTDRKPASMTPSWKTFWIESLLSFVHLCCFLKISSVSGLNCYLEDIRPHHCSQTPLKQGYVSLMDTEIPILVILA